MTPPQTLDASDLEPVDRARPPDAEAVGRAHGDRPARAHGLELVGPLAGSGYRQAPCLVRRADGQTLQLTPTLYRVLEAIDGDRRVEEIVAVLAERHRLDVDPEDIDYLIDAKLRPLGVLAGRDGSAPTVARSNPLLALRGRKVMADGATTVRLADHVSFLFAPPIVLAVLAAFVASSWWLFVDKGLGDATRHVIYDPGGLLVVFGLTLISAGFHELGHAAACRYGGATPGGMGAALYLVWPAFYTDVTDSYRLDRRGRLRVDVGGLYFNAVFSTGAFAVWAATRWDPLLVVMFLQLVQMLRQLVPLVRFDGYHILADLTGVPDLFARMKPVLLGLLPTRWGSPESTVLKPWARVVVTAWVAVVVPILLMSLLLMIVTLPRLVATAWDSLGLQWTALALRWSEADLARVLLGLISMAAIAVPVFSVTYLLTRIARRTARHIWRASQQDVALRVATVLVAAGLLLAATAAWWPGGQYRPIQADEPVTVVDGVRDVIGLGGEAVPASLVSARPSVEPPQGEQPRVSRAALQALRAVTAAPVDPPRRARFTPPAPPGDGDNQALAVNGTDGSSVFDVALSLLWVHGSDVTSVNEAYALASCRQCLTMAVAFQLILVIGDAEVAIPQNHAVAVNALCEACVTRALAVQLLLSLSDAPDEAALAELAEIWGRLESLTQDIETMTFAETHAALTRIEAEVVHLFEPDLAAAPSGQAAVDSADPSTSSPGPSGEGSSAPPAEAATETTSTTTEPPPEDTSTTTTTTTVPEGSSTTTTTG